MRLDTSPTWQRPLWFALAGIVVGLLAHHMDWLLENSLGQSSLAVGYSSPLSFTLALFLPTALLLWHAGRSMAAPVFLVVMLAVAAWSSSQLATYPMGDAAYTLPTFMSFAFYPLLIIAVGIALTLVQAWQRERPHFSYPRLFAYAWDNVHSVLLASIFALLTFLLLLAAAELFESILPSDAWEDRLTIRVAEHYWVIGLGALGAGLGIIQQHGNILLRLTLVFALYRLLAYLLAVIILGFTALLLPQWQQFFSNHEAAGLLLGLVTISILLLNAFVESDAPSLPRWANWLFGAQLLMLPLLVGLAAYALLQRIGQYGLSPERMLGLVVAGVLLAYTLAYAVQWLRQRATWTEGLKTVNPPLAILTAATSLLLLTPVLDPQGWSTRHQMARLQSGAVDATKFDYHSLRHQFGKPGQEAVAAMQTWHDHPQYAAITKGIAASVDPYPATDAQAVTQMANNTRVYPEGKTVDVAAFLTQAAKVNTIGLPSGHCIPPSKPNVECLLVLQDVNRDGKDEALLLAIVGVSHDKPSEPQRYHLDATLYALDKDNLPLHGKKLANATHNFRKDEQGNLSTKQDYLPLTQAEVEQVKAAALAGTLIPVMPELPELQLGGQRLREQP